MGSHLGYCCGGSLDNNIEEDPASAQLKINLKTGEAQSNYSNVNLQSNESQNLFYNGLHVNLILQSEKILECQIQLDRNHIFLLLTNNKKARIIHMTDIKEILSTCKDLERIEKEAGIQDYDICAAIHLETTNSCIPLFFKSKEEKNIFVTLTEKILAKYKTKE